ncbi:Metalloprotease TIKI2, partial [Varanus komodoensis]
MSTSREFLGEDQQKSELLPPGLVQNVGGQCLILEQQDHRLWRSRANINPPSKGSPATAAPTINFFEHVQPSSSSMPPHYSEEDSLPPHLLLPDSISQLEEFGRQKKWHKKQYKNHRQRQFNDLWVRIEDGPWPGKRGKPRSNPQMHMNASKLVLCPEIFSCLVPDANSPTERSTVFDQKRLDPCAPPNLALCDFVVVVSLDEKVFRRKHFADVKEHNNHAFPHQGDKRIHLSQPIHLVFRTAGPAITTRLGVPASSPKLSQKRHHDIAFNCFCLCGNGSFSVGSTESFLTKQGLLSAISRKEKKDNIQCDPVHSQSILSPDPSWQRNGSTSN